MRGFTGRPVKTGQCGKYVPAIVTDTAVDDHSKDLLEVSSMKKSGKLYVWPCSCGNTDGLIKCSTVACQDISWVDFNDMVLQDKPELEPQGRRGYRLV